MMVRQSRSAALPWILTGSAALTALVIGLAAVAFWPPKIEVSGAGLSIRGGVFARTLPRTALQLDRARVVDRRAAVDLTPQLRTFGAGLPGYSSGWFRLKNQEKALVFLGRDDRALYIPTVDGYVLLIAPEDPDGALRALRAGRD